LDLQIWEYPSQRLPCDRVIGSIVIASFSSAVPFLAGTTSSRATFPLCLVPRFLVFLALNTLWNHVFPLTQHFIWLTNSRSCPVDLGCIRVEFLDLVIQVVYYLLWASPMEWKLYEGRNFCQPGLGLYPQSLDSVKANT
jgi:hypothetical protein